MASHRFNAGAPGRLRRGSASPGLPSGPNILAVAHTLCRDRIVRRAARLTHDDKLGRAQQQQIGVLHEKPDQRQDEEGGGACG